MNSQDSKKEMRLAQYMAHCGVASRRACEEIILDGRVTINGIKAETLGTKVSENDSVCVDGNEIHLEEKMQYVLLNKPEGYVCSSSDENDRPTAVSLLKDSYSERLYNVGRLDMFSQGLIIFTNDGEFARKLSHPSAELEKEYIVEATSTLPEGMAQKFMNGVRVDNVFYKAKSAVELNARRMKIVLIEGKNREIRRVFESFGMRIKFLRRVRIGCVGIEGIEPGKFRDLTQSEINALLKLCKN